MNSRRTTGWIMVVTLALCPLLSGATCSRNAVAQSAATSFFNTIANGVAGQIITLLKGE